MTKKEWKEFWDRINAAASNHSCIIHKTEADGGYRVLVQKELETAKVPTQDELKQNGVIIASARYGYRCDVDYHLYEAMLKIQWEGHHPVPFGMSKFRTVYVSIDPEAVFAMLYA